MKYVKTFEEFLNESIGDIYTNEDSQPSVLSSKEKQSLNKRMYETIEEIYKEASEFELNDNPTNTFELFLKESFITFAEMITLVLKENTEISKAAAIAALRKYNEKGNDNDIVVARVNQYLNELMADVKTSHIGKMDEMIKENPVIAKIAAEALDIENTNNK